MEKREKQEEYGERERERGGEGEGAGRAKAAREAIKRAIRHTSRGSALRILPQDFPSFTRNPPRRRSPRRFLDDFLPAFPLFAFRPRESPASEDTLMTVA